MCLTSALVGLAATAAHAAGPAADGDRGQAPGQDFRGQAEWFERRIRPVLMTGCARCHGEERAEGGLRVDSREALLAGGESGPALVPGEPQRSPLLRAHAEDPGAPGLPAEQRLSDRQIADLTAWIEAGAPWPADRPTRPATGDAGGQPDNQTHWAFRPIADPEPPAVRDAGWARTPIDRFILAEMERRGLRPVERAGRRTLIRRAAFDLTGLPPTPRQVHRFLEDASPDAFRRLVDELLASPEYGRRWGRHWLDLARYADTAGDTSDYPIPEAYLYRDYVIDAFNADKPYDRFIIEQLAGDILAEREQELLSERRFAERVIATGFIALSRQFGPGLRNEPHLTIEDTINTIGEALLGMTVGCARCHDHKFEPIPTEDYYGLYGYFQSTLYPHAGSEEAPRPGGLYPLTTDPELSRRFLEYTERVGELGNKILQKKRGRNLPKSLEEYQRMLAELEANRPPVERAAFAVRDADPGTQIANALFREPKITNKAGDAHVQISGEPNKQGKLAPRGYLSAIDPNHPEIPEGGSGRLQLARWIASPDNPLTARVMVNRIWQWHFGRGLVATPSNFGTQGQPPTHGELLDWLASRFIESGWSIKHVHRLIMNSAVYQMASAADEDNLRLDADNRWYWRFERRRLDAEQIRDAILAVSGALDESPGGPHPFPPTQQWGEQVHYTQHEPFRAVYPSQRRSVYLMTQRLHKHPFLGLFDAPDRAASTPLRRVTTVPLQALFMMNSDFIDENARAMASRILNHSGDDAQRLRYVHELAWSRPPTDEQRDAALGYLDRFRERQRRAGRSQEEAEHLAWTSYARVLLSSNAFMYVD